jgi:hypothetical protein
VPDGGKSAFGSEQVQVPNVLGLPSCRLELGIDQKARPHICGES